MRGCTSLNLADISLASLRAGRVMIPSKTNRFLSVKGGGLLTASSAGSRSAQPIASTSATTLDDPARSEQILDLTVSDEDDDQFEVVNPFKRRKVDPPVPTPSPNPKPRAKPKPKPKIKLKEKEKALQSTMDWPVHFKKLEQVFKVSLGGLGWGRRMGACRLLSRVRGWVQLQAINTVYTFASARKSLATTFDVLRGSVERLLGR